MNTIALIPAAGESQRMGQAGSKLFVTLNGTPILGWTLSVFEKARNVNEIILIIRPEDREPVEELVQKTGITKVHSLVAGGPSRQESVGHGLFHIAEEPDVIVIHDAARPFVQPQQIDEIVDAALKYGSVVYGLPVSDTLKRVGQSQQVIETVSRDGLYQIQTPEAFRFRIILEAYQKALDQGKESPDDAELVERLGHPVTILPGDPQNIKVTRPEDLDLAERIARGFERVTS